MSLSRLTDPTAVVRATEEFDRIGRDQFLRQYGFGQARSYYLQHQGRLYDSKAIVGAAYGYQHGSPLGPSEFSGGDATVAPALSRLGFLVVRGLDWRIPIGEVTLRSRIHGEYGGSTQGGIEPSAQTPNVIIYTDPEVGALHGYNFDGWVDDAQTIFDYTGEGQSGDQRLESRGNAAILNHVQAGRTIRLFETLDQAKRTGGKRQEYIGAFRVDPTDPYRWEEVARHGQRDRVIVFRLLREDVLPQAQPPSTVEDPSWENNQPRTESTAPTGQVVDDRVQLVSPEANDVVEYNVTPRSGERARREESQLVKQFEGWLTDRGHQIHRARIRPIGESNYLVTDTLDVSANVLYEAKSKADRATIRLAVGQLLDYLRFLPDVRGSILLPEEPSVDLEDFILSCDLSVTFPIEGSWVTRDSM